MKFAVFEGCPGENFFAEVIGGVAVVIECVPEREQIPDVIDESGDSPTIAPEVRGRAEDGDFGLVPGVLEEVGQSGVAVGPVL